MSMLGKSGGYTIVEVLVVTVIMGLVCAGAMAIMIGSASCFDSTSAETAADADAAIAMGKIVNDVREAKSAHPIADNTRLRVVFPQVTSDGYYDRYKPDMGNQIDYYLSDSTGVPGHEGDWLWKGKSDGDREPLKRGIVGLDFEQDGDSTRSVKITITSEDESAGGPKQTHLTQRVVYLRNY